MKTAAEVIKMVIQDGGFRELAKQCGHKGSVTQWQDIHNIILAIYESLLSCAVNEYCKKNGDENVMGIGFGIG